MITWYRDDYDWQGYVQRRLCFRISTSPFEINDHSYRLHACITGERGGYYAPVISSHKSLDIAKDAAQQALDEAMNMFAIHSLELWVREKQFNQVLKVNQEEKEAKIKIKVDEIECEGRL